MSSTPPEPPAPPAPPKPPAPPPPEPPDPNDLAGLVERLAAFDPADIERKLAELEGRDVAPSVRDALAEGLKPLMELGATLRDGVATLLERAGGAPAPGPTPPPKDEPPAPPTPPAPPAARSGLLSALFDVPVVPKQ